jgi:hypothetical protein
MMCCPIASSYSGSQLHKDDALNLLEGIYRNGFLKGWHSCFACRHAESLGNVDKNTYCNVPDHTVPLTDRGRQQVRRGPGKFS